MIHVSQQSIGGEDVWVLLAAPNVDAAIDLTVAYETRSEESRSGVGHRRPVRSAPRLAIAYDWIGGEADVATLRNFFGSVGDGKVLIPLWFDRATLPLPAMFSGQVTVGWEDGYANVAVAEGGASLDRPTTAPAIIGRIERPDHRFLSGAVARCRIKVLEDSVWAQRVTIHGSAPVSWPAGWKPDWTGPTQEVTRDRMEYDQIGDGRLSSPAGYPVTTWRQQARINFRREDLGLFLAWYHSKRGGYAAFAAPSFFQPGADTPQAPHVFSGVSGRGYVRMADQLRLRWQSSGRVQVEVALEQVLGTSSEQHGMRATAFEMWSDADPDDCACLTDAEAPFSVGEQVYTPARVELREYVSSLKLESDNAEVRVHLDDVPQIAPIIRHETDIPVRCRIHAVSIGVPVTSTLLTSGTCGKWRLAGPRGSFQVRPFHGVLSRKIPRFLKSRSCNYALFDGGCSRVNPAAMDKSNWRINGSYHSQWGGSTVRIVALSGVPSGMDAAWVQRGWIEVGTGVDKQVRVIASATWYPDGDDREDGYGAGAVLHLVLGRPIRTDVAPAMTAVVIYAGCDGSYGTCKDKFNNGQAFGGFPFAPSYIAVASRNMPTPGK